MNLQFVALCDRYFRDELAAEPEEATLLGASGHDDRLRDTSEAGQAAARDRSRRLLADLDEHVPADSLDPRQRAELALLRTRALTRLREPGRIHLEPLLLPYTVLQHQLARISDDIATWSAVTARLRATPCFLKHALSDISVKRRALQLDGGLATLFARDLLPDAAAFLRHELAPPPTLPDALRLELHAASHAAADAFLAAAAGLREHPTGDAFALGDDETAWRLQHWYGLGRADELCAEAADELRAAQADLVRAADRWSSGEGGPAVTDLPAGMAAFRALATRTPGHVSEAIPLYRQATARILAWIRDHALFDLPDPLDLAFWPTPPAVRRVVGQASNWPAPLLRPGPAGFVVTLDPGAHPLAGAVGLAVHEGIPGHALQSLSWQQCLTGQRLAPAAFLGLADDLAAARDDWSPHLNIEGWAVWCEHLAHEHGLLDPAEALFFHVSRAIRAVRVIVDLGLAGGRTGRADAAAWMAEATAMPLAWCEGQVLRYTRIPLQAVTYRLGYLGFRELAGRCRAAWGPEFSLARFHRWVLAWPPVPPARIDPAA